MQTTALFRKLNHPVNPDGTTVNVLINGQQHTFERHLSVAAALLITGPAAIRTNLADNSPRGPYCMMGACFECLVEVDGVPNVQSCMITVAEGMTVNTKMTKS